MRGVVDYSWRQKESWYENRPASSIDKDLRSASIGRAVQPRDDPGKRRTGIAMLVLAALLLSALFSLLTSVSLNMQHKSIPRQNDGAPVKVLILDPHAPIFIDGNAGFTNASGVVWGRGMESDPYIIRGWNITSSTANEIEIQNTDAYFVVEGCCLESGSLWYVGISLTNCTNGMLVNNTCLNNAGGIVLSMSVNDTLISNNCSRNSYGILIDSSSRIILRNNSCTENDCGISFYRSTNNQLANNSCLSNRVNGTEFFSLSNNNTLVGNRCNSNGGNGIDVDTCSNETLISNTCFNNAQGIVLYLSSNNTLGNNTCGSNSDDGIFLFISNGNTLINNTCSSNSYVGMFLFSSNNNTLTNNTCTNNVNGIYLSAANNNTLIDNNCSCNSFNDMALYDSNKNAITDNNCSSSGYNGVVLLFSNNNTLFKNTCNSNFYVGIGLTQSNDNMLIDNICGWNTHLGISLNWTSKSNEISLNLVLNNSYSGVFVLDESANNLIWNNTFVGNNGATDTYDPSHIQAYDDGTNNWWNSSDGYGNWWSDWRAPDDDWDGIVDEPYNISGSADAKDFYPRTIPGTPIPEFGMTPLVVMVMLAAIVLAREGRRRKAL